MEILIITAAIVHKISIFSKIRVYQNATNLDFMLKNRQESVKNAMNLVKSVLINQNMGA